MKVFILAAGKSSRISRITGQTIKPLLPISDGGESIIARTVRQCHSRHHTPTIVTRGEIASSFSHLPADIFISPSHATTCNTLLSTSNLWDDDRTVILLGDTVYARDAMDMIFSSCDPFLILGDEFEIYALSFGSRSYEKIKIAAETGSEHIFGKLRYLARAYYGIDTSSDDPALLKHMTPLPFGGATMDVDTQEQYRQLYFNTHKRLRE